MKHVLKVLNEYIGSQAEEIKRKNIKIKELMEDKYRQADQIRMLRNDLFELSKEHFKK
jgi:hypothetical protein